MTISGQEALITENIDLESVELAPLRADKQKIFEALLRYFESRREGYIKVPTGWGKTFLSKHIMREYYREGKFVLFLVSMNNPLLSQTYFDQKKNAPLFPNSSILSSEYRVDKDELAEHLKNRPEGEGFVLFASLQTVLGKKNALIKELVLEQADLVVVDEIHNFINNKGNDFLNEFGEKTRLFGMTATPFQGVVGSVKFVDEISGDMREVYEKTLPECILDGELADLKYTITESNQDILDVFDFEKGLSELDRTDLFLDCSSVARIKQVVRRTQLAKDIYEAKIKADWAKTLVFCAPVRKQVYGLGADKKKINAFHAKLAAALFNGDLSAEEFENDPEPAFPLQFENYTEAGGFREAAYISSELPKAEQQALLEAFKEVGKPPFVLCTVGMLIEGFDFPALENLLLLRPTLSMRLFEQQLGRVIRLSKATGKTKGRVFEISDNFNSLYERFGDNVFGNRKIEQIQMLQPEIKLEELFSEGDSSKTIRALKSGKIKISKLDLISRKKEGERPREIPVRLPPTTLRARYFSQLLGLTEAKDVGLFEREKRELMRSALRFRVRGAEDAAEIAKLTILANKLKREAYEDRRLKDNSRRYKPKVFREVEWLLKLRALNSLKYECLHLPLQEKNKALKLLGFEPDFRQIDSFRAKCLKRGSAQKTLPELIKVLAFVSRLSSEETYQFLEKKKKDQWKRELSPAVYWGSCFIEDSPEIRELFESTEWDRQVKNLIK